MKVFFAIIFLFTKKKFGDVLALDFSVTTNLIPYQVFLRFCQVL